MNNTTGTTLQYNYTNTKQGMLFPTDVQAPPPQLLKWVGNKQRSALAIASHLPRIYNKYIEPFIGTGAVLATLNPHKGIAGDTLKPLIEIMLMVQNSPSTLIESYSYNWHEYQKEPKPHYLRVLDSFNRNPNGLDLLFLSRTCYGGVVRFTRKGKMSTPIGPHDPIHPDSFARRVYLWKERISNTIFLNADHRETMNLAETGDVIYCDPPYVDSQSILYGSQQFKLGELFESISQCVTKGARVALSIDGSKKSGSKVLHIDFPEDLFKQELFVDNGHSMLRRFQKAGQSMDGEFVKERLLLTW